MRIGELADVTGVPAPTIRFYERSGLLPPAARRGNGYRDYDDGAATRLDFIRTAQTAGLTLAEIGGVLDLRSEGTPPCAHVQALLTAKLDAVRQRVRELSRLEGELASLLTRSRELDPADCSTEAVCHLLAPTAPVVSLG